MSYEISNNTHNKPPNTMGHVDVNTQAIDTHKHNNNVHINEYDFTPNTFNEPYDILARVQHTSPVVYSEPLNGWLILGFDEVAQAFKHPDFISGNFEQQVKNQLQGIDISIAEDFVRVRKQMMLHNDANEHRRLRKTCNPSFGKQGLARLTPILEKAVIDIVADLPSASLDGSQASAWDFATDFAEPLSTRVIADLFAVPFEDRVFFQKTSDDVSRFFGNAASDVKHSAIEANNGIIALEKYFYTLLQARQVNPGDDLLSLLLEANEEGMLTLEEVIAQCVLIMMAGHYTVIDQLCNSFVAFQQENIWSTLNNNRALIPNAMDESIRLDGSVMFMARTAKKNTLFAGQKIQEGETIFLGMGAANRDPKVFDQPDIFDINRVISRHMGFAHGPHLCIGMGLARIEMRLAFEALLDRFPDLSLDVNKAPSRKAESLFFRGFYHIPVTHLSRQSVGNKIIKGDM